MARVIVFHHALGLTEGVTAFANALAAAGHDVSTPDLFGGAMFDSVDAGVSHAESIGFMTIAESGAAQVDSIDGPIAVVGFSLGVLPAQKLSQQHPDVTAAVLCHSALPLGPFGDSWPHSVALQLHMGERDPFVAEDRDAVDQLEAAATTCELHWYNTEQHLIADVTSRDYDAAMAGQLVTRTLEFLAQHA